jgi:gamma-glutamyltranspeptidase/glutathione hydrolase
MATDPFGTATVHAPKGMVASADHLASGAGVAILRAGGTAVDAAVAAGAVLAVTNQHQNGMGGDLFALVHRPGQAPEALCAAGRAGAGADPIQLRAEGHTTMPRWGDIRAATVPGCVDGWVELHRRYGRLSLAQVLEPATTYAAAGFPASAELAWAATAILDVPGADDYRDPAMAAGGRLVAGTLIRRPGVAAALEAVASAGRSAFYLGDFGAALVDLGNGYFTRGDLARNQAEWMTPVRTRAWGHDLWAPPPPSQGYLTLAGAWVADHLDLPGAGVAGPADARWAHLLSEAARQVGRDRPAVLFDGADGAALVAEARLAERLAAVDPDRRAPAAPLAAAGDTTAVCAVDSERTGVVLIQSNAGGWGSGVAERESGIFLHNRGIGFSLQQGHVAEWAPGARPPHTLAPALVTTPDGRLRMVLGTMGGDGQPQVLLQLLARALAGGEAPGPALDAGRWVLGPGGFATWEGDGPSTIRVESHASEAWDEGLRARGHEVERSTQAIDLGFGQAHMIQVGADGVLDGAADPRAPAGAAAGY